VEIGCRIGGNLVASRDFLLSIANPPVGGHQMMGMLCSPPSLLQADFLVTGCGDEDEAALPLMTIRDLTR
jgi:hypothetical protein